MVRGSVIVRPVGANQEVLTHQPELERDHLGEFSPASRTSSGGGSQEKAVESWETRCSFVDTWISRQDF